MAITSQEMKSSTAGAETQACTQNNLQKLHIAMMRLEEITKAQQDLLDLITDEANKPCDPTSEPVNQVPSLHVLLTSSHEHIHQVIDRALTNVDVMRRLLYGDN